MRSIIKDKKNKRGQFDFGIITFVGLVVALILIAPLILSIVNKFLTPLGTALGNQSAVAGTNVNYIQNSFGNLLDGVIIFMFVINVLMLFVSAFLVDVHPIFIIVYIIVAFLTMIFAPNIIDAVNNIWGESTFSGDVAKLPLTNFILDHFGIIIMSIILVTGVILFTKFGFGRDRR